MRRLSFLLVLSCACGSSPPEEPLRGPDRIRTDGREVVTIVATGPGTPIGTDPEDEPDLGDVEALHEIATEAQWHELAARPDNAVFARTEVVKFIIDLSDERRLWLHNTRRWPIHYYFARDRLANEEHPVEGHALFNVREYRRDDRRFVLGSIVRYLDADRWTFEMIAGDNLPADRVLTAFEQIRDAVYFGDRLAYRPLSDLHERVASRLGRRMPTVQTTEILGDLSYQPVTDGTTFGYLRIVRGALDPTAIRPNDIVVTATVPDDLPMSSGLVTSTLQAPLAHVAVLSENRGTPNMALRGAVTDTRFTQLEGQLVKLVVGAQDFTVERAQQSEADAFFASRRPAGGFAPARDLTRREIADLCSLRVTDTATVGAKAAQLGEVCQLQPGIRTPGGFVIPFFHYYEHLRHHRLESGLGQMLNDQAFRAQRPARATRLDELRTIIERVEIDPDLVSEVHRRIRSGPNGRWIFRSSTNAEDLVGFNGAGLYRSVVVSARPGRDEIADAIRQVWASVWTLRGFDERDWYRIDHQRVAMGVLIQPFVDDIVANGVAVTRNPFNADRPAVFINVQARGGSVTDAGDTTPEQHLVYTYLEAPEPEVLARSSETNGRPILREADVIRLTEVLQQLHARMVPHYGGGSDAVDVEFLVTRDRSVVVVQTRPY